MCQVNYIRGSQQPSFRSKRFSNYRAISVIAEASVVRRYFMQAVWVRPDNGKYRTRVETTITRRVIRMTLVCMCVCVVLRNLRSNVVTNLVPLALFASGDRPCKPRMTRQDESRGALQEGRTSGAKLQVRSTQSIGHTRLKRAISIEVISPNFCRCEKVVGCSHAITSKTNLYKIIARY